MADEDYQEFNIFSLHRGKMNILGELSIPELPDLVTAPLSTNAIGMKAGVLYKWNSGISAWERSGSAFAVKYTTAITSAEITKAFMNSQYPAAAEDSLVLFTNITDYSANIGFVQKYDGVNNDWYIILYASKLS